MNLRQSVSTLLVVTLVASPAFAALELSVAWKMVNGVTDPLADPDGDGINNAEEFRTGTNPNSSASKPEGAGGINYVLFRDHFNDSQYVDRWYLGALDVGTDQTLVEGGTELTATVQRPASGCKVAELRSIATVDAAQTVYRARVRLSGRGRTSLGFLKDQDSTNRIEITLDGDTSPYAALRSWSGGVLTQVPAITGPYQGQSVDVRLVKNGVVYTAFVNQVIVGQVTNAAIGNTGLRPSLAFESCVADAGGVDSRVDIVELLLDRDADGLADTNEDRNANGAVDTGESNPLVADSDGDTILDGFDNCTFVANSNQLDSDGDGYGNFCDADLDNTGTVTAYDFGLMRSVLGKPASANPLAAAADLNGSGSVTADDFGLLRSAIGKSPGPSAASPAAYVNATPVSANPVLSIGPAPAWVLNLTPRVWAAVGTNTIADVDPKLDPVANANYPFEGVWNGNAGQNAVVDGWNGGAFATRMGANGALIVWGGGHKNYHGNEVYAFDMAARSWTRLTNPYAGNIDLPAPNGIWPDGSPSVPETYGFSAYRPASNSFITFRAQKDDSPVLVPVAAFFSLDTLTWRIGTIDSADPSTSGGWSVYDNYRDVFWLEGGDSSGVFAKFDPVGNAGLGAWTNYSLKSGILDNRAARDPVNDSLVITDFQYAPPKILGLDLTAPAGAAIELAQGGTPPAIKEPQSGWAWSSTRSAFIYWMTGDAVYEVRQIGPDWRTATWTWTKLTNPGNVLVPLEVSPQGPYNRFQVVRYNEAEIAIVVTGTQTPVYVFRIS